MQQAALRKIVDRQRYHGAAKRSPARDVVADAVFSRDDLERLAATLPSRQLGISETLSRKQLSRALARLSKRLT